MKQTPIQKAIDNTKEWMEYYKDQSKEGGIQKTVNGIVVLILERQLSHLQSLLTEERQMVEDAYERGSSDGFFGSATFPFDYFTQTYQQ
jgi:hypothetical protein